MKWLDLLKKILEILLSPKPVPPTPEPPAPKPKPPKPEPQSFFKLVPGDDDLLVYDRLLKRDNLKDDARVEYLGAKTDEGLEMRKPRSGAKYQLPTIREGFVEFEVKGLKPDNVRAYMLMIMYDEEYENGNPWRANIQQHSPSSTRTRNYLRVRWLQNFGSSGEERYDKVSRFYQWQPSKFHKVRLEWRDTWVSLSVDGREHIRFNKQRPYLPKQHVMELGGTSRAESPLGAVYREVKIGRYDSSPLEPEPDEFSWDKIKGELLKDVVPIRNIPGGLHLTHVDVEGALKVLDDVLIWDGIRNPNAALACDQQWQEYNGISRARVREIVDESGVALRRLRVMIRYEVRDNRAFVVGGKLPEGRMSERVFQSEIKHALARTATAAKLNGIKNLCK